MDITSMIFGLIGGLGLFLYGMKMMGEGLENSAGDKLKVFFEKITSNPVKGILVGTIVTGIIQSSSATTVMVVGFVNAGLMNLYQAAGVIMGANIGTTVTGQLVAFKLTKAAPIFVGIGTAIVLFSKGKKLKQIGDIVLGFGILFMGMQIMESSMKPLTKMDEFKNLITTLSHNPFLGILVGMGMTAVVQSSSATIGILIAIASTGTLPIEVALPILFGDNIGTCVTAMLASIGTNKTARKAALIHLSFNTIGTIIFTLLLVPYTALIKYISPGDTARQIANAHTLFNVTNVFIQASFIKYLVLMVNKIIPGSDVKEKMGPKYLDERLLETPVIAVGQVVKEIIRMANKAKENLELSMDAFRKNDEKLVEKVVENEGLINLLEKEIVSFLAKLSNKELSAEQSEIVTSMFHVVNDIERIGDHAENLSELAYEKISSKLIFSQEALSELDHIYNYTLEALNTSIESFEHNDPNKAQSVLNIEEKIDNLEKQLRTTHIRRLHTGICNAHSGTVFLDMISNFERVGDHAMNIAESVYNR
ncbi:Na/Pi cotransporter family protein [Clostridium sp. SYSU_GA19001]|uniref:Na/Pi cotransporter family protein n=1 Tax=Clostridium caldaquaticum TaxID=2940653 RepID=UPI002076DA3D|nr:Na/Pi cotransporter family protein [Clostridium caldaquaticum]MCM8711399.1 Na/Pi cotransporter family protein [Clostridium caldaquaticum]